MIFFAANCRFRLLPRFKRYFVHDTNNVPTERRMWNAAWLTFMVARTDRELSERMVNLLRKSAREIVTLDNLKKKFDHAVTERAHKLMQRHGERTDRMEGQIDDLRAKNNALYQENCEMRAAIRTFNKIAKPTLGEYQIKRMVDRFLGWKLPANFSPDGGISFKPTFNDNLLTPMKHEPSGTNLLDADQATAMVRHMTEGLSEDDA